MYSESTCDVIYKHQRKFNAQIVRQKIKWESFLYMKCDGNSGWLRGNFWFYTHMYFQLVIVRNGNFFFFFDFISFIFQTARFTSWMSFLETYPRREIHKFMQQRHLNFTKEFYINIFGLNYENKCAHDQIEPMQLFNCHFDCLSIVRFE